MSILGTLIRHALAGGLVVATAAAQAQLAPNWSLSSTGVNAASSALDASNNVLASGTTLTPAMTLSKVGAGGALLWQQTFAGAAKSRATGVAVDAQGNVIQVGMLLSDTQAPVGTVVLKYSPAGVLLWQEVLSATYGLASAVTTDSAGSVYVLSRMATADGLSDEVVLSKLSAAGLRLWEQRPGLRFLSGQPIVIAGGRVVVAGSGGVGSVTGQSKLAAYDSAGTLAWSGTTTSNSDLVLAAGPSGELVAAGSNGSGFQVVKYDAQLNALWQNTVPAKGATRRVAVDGSGNILITGPSDTNTGAALMQQHDWLTAKLSSAGTVTWTRAWGDNGGGADELPNAMALAGDGSIVVTGQGSLASTDSAGNTVRGPSTTTVKYDAAGTVLWSSSVLPGTQGRSASVGSDGAAYVVGSGPVELGATPQTVLRYSQAAANKAPVAMASASTSAGVAPLTVTFSSAGSSDADGSIAAWRWDFGDNTSSTLANPSHSYAAGSYKATLTVTDNQGATATSAPIAITANAPTTDPVAVRAGVPTAISLPASTMPSLGTLTATVKLSTTSGATVRLYSSASRVASVPTSVVVPAGATSATFTITAGSVSRNTTATIYASANGKLVNARITVQKR